MTVKAGICVAYDWAYLKFSLPRIYALADSICLSVDEACKSWNGNNFEFDWEAFDQMVASIDTEKKIKVLKESFFDQTKTPIENECHQRKRMADFLGKADWIVQIDTDEIIINPEDFRNLLDKHRSSKRALNIHGMWINLIKHTGSGFIYSITKTPPLATNRPVYEYGRTNGHFSIYSNTFLGHITWARPEKEVYYKLKNWGHSHEFNGMSFFKIWQALDEDNWKYIKDFHPMNKGSIPRLYYQEARDMDTLVGFFDLKQHALTSKELIFNNIWASRAHKLIKKLF